MAKNCTYLISCLLSLTLFILTLGPAQSIQNSDPKYLIVYPRSVECVFGTCPHNVGLLNPQTGDIRVLNTGDIWERSIRGALSAGQIAYTERSDTSTTYFVNVEGELLFSSRETFPIEPVLPIAWSPNGMQIAFRVFQSADNENTGNLAVINIDGSGLNLLTQGFFVVDFKWLPNNETINFLNENDGFYSVNVDGSMLRKLSTIEDVFYQMEWSVDGSHVAFGVEDSINSVNVYDGTIKKLISGNGSILYFGKDYLLYLNIDNDKEERLLKLFNFTDSTTKLLNIKKGSWLYNASPDGKQVLYLTANSVESNQNFATLCIFEIQDQSEQCFNNLEMYWDGSADWVSVSS